jgi:hypothetical protein
MRLFRSMREDADGLPRVEATARGLGVRPGPKPRGDVDAIQLDDQILPGTGGMSVVPDDPMNLLRHRRPASLGGTGPDPVWYIELDDLDAELRFRPDRPTHGLIEPSDPTALREFQQLLANTRARWNLHCR